MKYFSTRDSPEDASSLTPSGRGDPVPVAARQPRVGCAVERRPKAAVIDASGLLAIAKFPRAGSDEWDVAGWEEVQLRLARRAGIDVTASKLAQVGERHVLIVDRFDRQGGRRTGFVSALTMLEAADGEQHSYLEIADAIERYSPRPTKLGR